MNNLCKDRHAATVVAMNTESAICIGGTVERPCLYDAA
jgi:hypothetical protein